MLKNYLKVAFRNSVKHKFYAVLNVLGLGIGMACCLLILLYVSHELSYDTFHSKADRIYRVVTDIKTPTETLRIGVTSTPMAAAMKADLAEVEDMVRLDDVEFLVTINGNTIQEDDAMIADASFFQILISLCSEETRRRPWKNL